MYGADNVAAGGLITGIGRIRGQECMIVANDATVKGGTYYPITVKKHLRAQAIAAENNLPCVYLVDSGGAHLPSQQDVFPDRDHFGRIFYNQANMSAKRHTADRGRHGILYRGRRLRAGDVRSVDHRAANRAPFFSAARRWSRPPPAKWSAPRNWVAPMCMRAFPGVVDHYAQNDEHALAMARDIVASLNRVKQPDIALRDPVEPHYPIDDLYGIVPSSLRKPFDIREIIARLVDGSEFNEFKQLYGTTLICGFAHLYGVPVGIVANNGILFSESALKGAHFVELCAKRRIPLIFLQNITGFMVGKKYEQRGIARDGAKMVTAVACARVPKLTLVVGGSFGAGNYAMCGRAYGGRFLWMWPNARISVMGGEQAATVLAQVKRDGLEGQWRNLVRGG